MKTPEQGESWGILGGTFDPIHNGHIGLASEIQKFKNLDGILLVPSFSHPFKKKQTVASYNDRLAMLKLAVTSIDSFYISTIEQDQSLTGFTLDTIKAIKKSFNGVKFYFIIGADNIAQLPFWYNANKIIKEIQIVAGKRPPFDIQTIENDFSDSIEYIETTEIEISSTEIKSMILKDESYKLRTILHPNVLQYIHERKLYL